MPRAAKTTFSLSPEQKELPKELQDALQSAFSILAPFIPAQPKDDNFTKFRGTYRQLRKLGFVDSAEAMLANAPETFQDAIRKEGTSENGMPEHIQQLRNAVTAISRVGKPVKNRESED